MAANNYDLTVLTTRILQSRKYRSLDIPPETITALLQQEMAGCRNEKELLNRVRTQLHHIMAPYLGDPDYTSAADEMDEAYKILDSDRVKITCQKFMESHASTKERIPFLGEFHSRLFQISGIPGRILDLACALHPLALPWMGLPAGVEYHAYDLHGPRIHFLNRFFTLAGNPPLAQQQDILLDPPAIEADVAFFFKEAHRFEQRQRGCNRAFWQALRVRWLMVSLPASSLTGRHDLTQQHRRLVLDTISGLPWQVIEFTIGNEMVFCIHKE